MAFHARSAVKSGGDLEVTLGIPMKDKWEALKVSDAAGVTFEIHVYRKGWKPDGQTEE